MKLTLFPLFACWIAAVHAVVTFSVETDRPESLYRCGETATFTVTAKDDSHAPLQGVFTARLDNFGPEIVATADIDLAKTNVFTLAGTLAKPGFLRLHIDGATKPVERRQLDFSVAFEPEKINPATPCPRDFLSFGLAAKDRLDAEVPLDAKMERVPEKSTARYDFYKISFATFGRRIYGLMSVPTDKKRAPFPVRVEVPGAGCGLWALKLNPAPDAICCFLTVNNFEPDENDLKGAKAKWDAINAMYRAKYGTREYSSAGLSESREAAYFYPVILGIDRAVDWIAARPDVDRRRFWYQGTSQGGGFGFYLTGLNRTFTRAAFFVPAIADTMGYLKGRQSGWPQPVESHCGEDRVAVERNAPYFDGANFASRVACPVRVAVGFSDTTCAPCAVYAAYNAIKVADKGIVHGFGMTHSCFGKFYKELGEWLRK